MKLGHMQLGELHLEGLCGSTIHIMTHWTDPTQVQDQNTQVSFNLLQQLQL